MRRAVLPLLALAALGVPGGVLHAQCPDGAPPPCRGGGLRPGALPDSHVIAVLPFRVSGTDTSLAEGLAELLAVEFTGEGAPRSADMGTVLRAWRGAGGGARAPLELTAARRMASRLGAGRILAASVVQTGQSMSVSAQVIGTSDGAITARAGPVRGSADSLPDMLHAIAGQLITMPAGAGAGFAGVPTDALRSYMAGRAAYRRADWPEAARQFERALQIDSTFAYAALGRIESDGWGPLPETDLPRIMRLAWDYRARLDPIHQAIARALLGPNYPAPYTVLELLEARAEVTRLAPDNADGWFFLGDALAHRGALVGLDGLGRGRVALERALALDPEHAEAALHLSSIGVLTNDPGLTRRYGPIALRLAPTVPFAAIDFAYAEGRSARLTDSIVRSIATAPTALLTAAPLYQTAPEMMDTLLIEAVFAERSRRAASSAERAATARVRSVWLLNRGRPAAADRELAMLDPPVASGRRVREALFSGGDEAAGAAAMRDWPGQTVGDTTEAAVACLRGMWWLQHEDSTSASRELAAMRSARHGRADPSAWCAPLIEAGVAVVQRRADAPALVARADSIIVQGMPNPAGWEGIAVGRLWAALGNAPAAVRAVRRREWFGGSTTGGGNHEAVLYREEGRWAALAGDTAGARTAYRRYLLLRANPEPSRVAQRDSVRAELAALDRR